MPHRDAVDMLKAQMESHNLSANQVAKGSGYESNSQVSRVLRREEPVPLARMQDFARGARITDEREREHFFLLVRLSHSPREIRDLFWRIQDQLETLARLRIDNSERVQPLSEKIRDLEAKLSEAEAKLKGNAS